jgi:hypothetical protein
MAQTCYAKLMISFSSKLLSGWSNPELRKFVGEVMNNNEYETPHKAVP